MKRWTTLSAGMMLVLAACSAHEERMRSANDPFGELSTSDIYTQKGVRYMENGALDIALEDLKHAIQLDPTNSDAHDALAVLYEKLGKTDEAERHFHEALSLNPENYGTSNNFGRFLCNTGHTEEAMAQFATVLAAPLYPQPWLPLSNAGLCLHRAGRTAEAETYLRKALEKYPNYPPALLEMVHVSIDTRQYLSARAFLQRYEAAAGNTPESLWLGVQTELALGNDEEAGHLAGRLGGEFPDSTEAVQARRLFSGH